MPELEKIALIDMDGTMANFEAAIRRDLKATMSADEIRLFGDVTLKKLEHIPHPKNRMDLIKRQPGWWARLDDIPVGLEIAQRLSEMGYSIHVLTQGPRKLSAGWAEKHEWFLQRLKPKVPKAQITITGDKGLVYGTLLVDDWPDYIGRWLKWRPRGLVLMPDRPYNKDYNHEQIVRYYDQETLPNTWPAVGRNIDAAMMAAKAAYDRKMEE